jgi:ATP adenylyltransferase
MIVMNKFPYNPGHVLVLPRRHCGELLQLSDAEYDDLSRTFRKAFQAITRAYEPSGINAGLNHGAVAGAGIPEHLHYHLVPRWLGDMNFFPLLAETKALPIDLPTSYDLLYKELSKKEYRE